MDPAYPIPAKPAMRVDVYSHHVRISGYEDTYKRVLYGFFRGLGHYGLKMVAPRQMARVITCTYATRTRDEREFRFHVHQLEELLRHLDANGIPKSRLHIVHHGDYVPATVNYHPNPARQPRDYQIPLIDYLVAPGRSKVLTLQTGKGKEQPLDAKIRIPGGWTTMGEVYLGQQVIAPDGKPTTIVGIYPQGKKPIYRVTFADGRSTECGAEHLWKVYYINTQPHRRWKVVNTLEMLRLISMPNPRVYVQLIESEETASVKLPIDPYLLGALLGDGGMSADFVTLSSADDFIVQEINGLLSKINHRLQHTSDYDYAVRILDREIKTETLRSRLAGMGLMGCTSDVKFIPEEYLEASTEQRWSLLQGLMDTDGTANTLETGGAISYSTVSEQLAKDVQYLVRSLGGIASITSRTTSHTHNGERKNGQLCYDVNIRVKTPSKLFRLPRKLERTNDNNQYAADLKLRVTSIELIGEKEAQCIAVDHPDHLYVTNDFIVTHNTFTFLRACAILGVRAALIIQGKYVEQWMSAVYNDYQIEKADLMVVRGSKDMRALIDIALAGELRAKFIIITSGTLNNYYREYEESDPATFPYGCFPDRLWEVLGVGVRGIDEVHQEFHRNFRADLYSHVPKTISLSATLESSDRFVERMYLVVWPPECRTEQLPFDQYIDVVALEYQFNNPNRIRYLGAKQMYSQIKLEQSILRQRDVMEHFTKMVTDLVFDQFIAVFEPGQKCLIFAATVEMCDALLKVAIRRWPDIMFGRYAASQGDEFEAMKINDVTFSTLKSAGTAIDLPNLLTVVMTDSIDSVQANQQAVGRLRPLKDWPSVNPKFVYIYAGNIPKQRMYHGRKKEKLKGRVKSHKTYITSYHI